MPAIPEMKKLELLHEHRSKPWLVAQLLLIGSIEGGVVENLSPLVRVLIELDSGTDSFKEVSSAIVQVSFPVLTPEYEKLYNCAERNKELLTRDDILRAVSGMLVFLGLPIEVSAVLDTTFYRSVAGWWGITLEEFQFVVSQVLENPNLPSPATVATHARRILRFYDDPRLTAYRDGWRDMIRSAVLQDISTLEADDEDSD